MSARLCAAQSSWPLTFSSTDAIGALHSQRDALSKLAPSAQGQGQGSRSADVDVYAEDADFSAGSAAPAEYKADGGSAGAAGAVSSTRKRRTWVRPPVAVGAGSAPGGDAGFFALFP